MIFTESVFYYDYQVNVNNLSLNFEESSGGGELLTQIPTGIYSLTNLLVAVEDALNLIGANTYTVTVDRSTRIITISCDVTFKLLFGTGAQASLDIAQLLGYDGVDTAFALSHIATNPSGKEYMPQNKLQSYVSPDDLQKFINPTVNKTGSGKIEVVRFGIEKFIEFNIKPITNIDQGVGNYIRTDLQAVENVRDFLRYLVTRGDLEFIPDRADRNTFITIKLEKTKEDSNGTGYRLKELFGVGRTNYFETDLLVFRVSE